MAAPIISQFEGSKNFFEEFYGVLLTFSPACADTLCRYFDESGSDPNEFDLILSGDLGSEGHALLTELCREKGLILGENLKDCGMIVYDQEKQSVNCGGSGCGCSAIVFSGYIATLFRQKKIRDVLLVGIHI